MDTHTHTHTHTHTPTGTQHSLLHVLSMQLKLEHVCLCIQRISVFECFGFVRLCVCVCERVCVFSKAVFVILYLRGGAEE